ncbi:MAG: Holliday junction resolvase RuvX [Hyphomicrobiaceae bacterium]
MAPTDPTDPTNTNLPRPYPFEDVEPFIAAIANTGRIIGIDPGTKTFGLALSDLSRMIASPLEVIRRTKFATDSERLLKLIREHEIVGIVVGLPSNLDGTEGPRAQSVRAFVKNLQKLTPLPILLWDERLSTVAAERALLNADTSRKKRAEVIDKVAATVILQGAMDRMRNSR